MVVSSEYLKQVVDIQLNKMNKLIESDPEYFSYIKEKPLIYGNQTIINENDKKMALRLDLRISYDEMKM